MKRNLGSVMVWLLAAFYRLDDLETMLGVRCVQELRKAGLCAISGRYTGGMVLDSFERAREAKTCQRAPGEQRKEKKRYGTERKKKEVGKDRGDRKVFPIPEHTDPFDVRGELEKTRREIRA